MKISVEWAIVTYLGLLFFNRNMNGFYYGSFLSPDPINRA